MTDTHLGVGKGVRVTFTPLASDPLKAGIAAVEEGTFEGGKWVPGRRLNGDEDDQGTSWRFDPRQVRTERISLYRSE